MKPITPARWPVRWQIAVLLVMTQLFAHAVTITTINMSISQAGGGPTALAVSLADPFVTVLKMIPPADTPNLPARFAALASLDTRFHVVDTPPLPGTLMGPIDDDGLREAIKARLPVFWQDRVLIFPTRARSIVPAFSVGTFGLAAPLWNGQWVTFEPRPDDFVTYVPRVVALMGLLILALPLMFLSVWSGALLVSPIASLASGVERFADNIDAPELPEHGPVEVRKATRAFNRMRKRIRKLISDRSQTLASIGHDMRTPLTRLRLRVELLEAGSATDAIEGDINALERMIDDALAFLRAENRPLKLEKVDLAVLARTVADEYADRGHAVAYSGPPRLAALCDHELMRRVLDNIVGNAVKFATESAVSVCSAPDHSVTVSVSDNGPGIPHDHRDKVLEPFTRVEAVRAGKVQEAQGFGLGLAIARDLVERHGGTLTLSENQPTGLMVSIRLAASADVGAARAAHV